MPTFMPGMVAIALTQASGKQNKTIIGIRDQISSEYINKSSILLVDDSLFLLVQSRPGGGGRAILMMPVRISRRFPIDRDRSIDQSSEIKTIVHTLDRRPSLEG